jgi:hypothetical protein
LLRRYAPRNDEPELEIPSPFAQFAPAAPILSS